MIILNISEVLPAPIKHKERENDILLITANRHHSFYPYSKHVLVLVIPFVSRLTSILSKKWRPFRNLKQQQHYTIQQQKIIVVPLFMRGYKFPVLRPLLNWLSYQLNKKKLIHLIREQKVSIIHAHNVHNTAYIAYKLSIKLKIPYIITSRKIHEYSKDKYTQEIMKKSGGIISINHHHKRIIDQIIPIDKSYLLPHGIDPIALSPPLIKETSQLTRIITICNLIPRKNIDKVLHALAQIQDPFIYDIYGDGPDLNRIQSIVSSLKLSTKVNLLGYIEHDKIFSTLIHYDLFIMPSENETLGRVYFEAMNMGIPIIASKHTGVDGYIEDGISGFLVDPNNIHEIRLTLSRLIAHPEWRKEVGLNGKIVTSDFFWEIIIHKLHHIYSSTLNN